jgi:sugar O-acyltransferase (sialic acid O-acetyltransferase NeuD family)
MPRRIAIVGAGGLAREVEWLLSDVNRVTPTWELVGFVVSDLGKLGPYDSKDRVIGDYSALGKQGVDAAAIGIGNPHHRVRVAEELKKMYPSLEWPTLVHPSAQLDRSTARLGEGVIIAAGVIGTVNVELEAHCFINLACTIGHEAKIGTGSVINPTVNISGGVRVGASVLIGTGAQVLQYLSIGDGAVVGAGAVVTRDVQPGVTVVGAPAKPRG